MKAKKCSGENCNYIGGLWKAKCKEHDGLCKNCALKRTSEVNGIKSSFKTLEKPKPIAKVSQVQLERLKRYKTARVFYLLGHQTCEAQLDGCAGDSNQIHHQKGRIGDLLWNMNFFVALCDNCHRWIEIHPKQAKELGFSLNRLDK